LLTKEVVASDEAVIHLAGLPAEVFIILSDDPGSVRKWLKKVSGITAHRGIGNVIFLDGEELLYKWWTFCFYRPKVISRFLMMNSPLTNISPLNGTAGIRRILKRLILQRYEIERNIHVFHLVGPGSIKIKERSVPDPVEIPRSREYEGFELPKPSDLDADLFWFGLFGSVSLRKRLDSVVEAIVLSRLPNAGLLVAGKLSAEVKALLPSMISKLQDADVAFVIAEGVMTDEELLNKIKSVDAVIISQDSDVSSGILLLGAAAGRRCVTFGGPNLRSHAIELGMGELAVSSLFDLPEVLLHATKIANPTPRIWATYGDFSKAILGSLTGKM
jgi:predicted nuclease of predicted toxin-antitoxin system